MVPDLQRRFNNRMVKTSKICLEGVVVSEKGVREYDMHLGPSASKRDLEQLSATELRVNQP